MIIAVVIYSAEAVARNCGDIFRIADCRGNGGYNITTLNCRESVAADYSAYSFRSRNAAEEVAVLNRTRRDYSANAACVACERGTACDRRF